MKKQKPPPVPKQPIRLACVHCDRDDHDFISESDLRQAIQAGWDDVNKVQSVSNSKSDREGDVLDWATHEGTCPECY